MKLKSLIQNGLRLEVAEVEIEFIAGIPQIHFLGLPDRIIKESFYRIKSALKSSEYKFPLTQQMIVNIKPNHLRKSSRGVELAVAIGILLKTKQIDPAKIDLNWVIYGELGLDGGVYQPTDLTTHFQLPKGLQVLTGWSKDTDPAAFLRIHEIKNLEVIYPHGDLAPQFERPQMGIRKLFSEREAEFLFLAATTGMNSLLAGDSGAGKTTIAKSLLSFLEEPTEDMPGQWKNKWRPLVMPHQSITSGAFLGGGANLFQGEVERVENGLLILDEFLLFNPEILEALRGPMVGEKLRLARGAFEREYECSFQVVATTNLCPCGKWTPIKSDLTCRYSRLKCSRTLEKLSGPIVDRFGLIMFTEGRQMRTITGDQILARVSNYRAQREKIKNTRINSIDLHELYPESSVRRHIYLQRAAEVYATERTAKNSAETSSELKLTLNDYKRAEEWVIKPFTLLEKGMS